MTLRFFRRGSAIHLRINSGVRGSSSRLATGVTVGIGMTWNEDIERFSTRDKASMQANARISEIEAFASRAAESMETAGAVAAAVRDYIDRSRPSSMNKPGSLFFSDFMEAKIKALDRGEVKSARGSRLSDKSIRSYTSALRTYSKFVKLQGYDIDLYEMDLMSKDVAARQRIVERSSKYWAGFVDYMVRSGFMPNAQQSIARFLGVFLRHAEKDLAISLYRDIRVQGEKYPIVVLPVDFYSRFVTDEAGMYDQFNDFDKAMYEIAAVILVTTLRISDAIDLAPENFTPTENGADMEVVNRKTGERTVGTIPYILWGKLSDNIRNYGRVYRKWVPIHAVNLQAMFAKYPELQATKSVERMAPDRRSTERVTKPLYEFMSPHALRRTAITTMLAMGVPDRQVKHLSGHTGDSRSFEKYVSFTEATQRKEILTFQEKVFRR